MDACGVLLFVGTYMWFIVVDIVVSSSIEEWRYHRDDNDNDDDNDDRGHGQGYSCHVGRGSGWWCYYWWIGIGCMCFSCDVDGVFGVVATGEDSPAVN